MRLLPIARSAAAYAMLVFVLTASLPGVACEAECAHFSTMRTHACCPALHGSDNSNASIAGEVICRHSASALLADLVAPAGLVAGLAVFSAVEPAVDCKVSETQPILVTASPPEFHLRI